MPKADRDARRADLYTDSVDRDIIDSNQLPIQEWEYDSPNDTEPKMRPVSRKLESDYFYFSATPGEKEFRIRTDGSETYLEKWNSGSSSWDVYNINKGIYNPRSFKEGRRDSQEVTSPILSVSGWYTIAETEAVNFKPQACEISFAIVGHVWVCKIGASTNNSVRDFSNTDIEIISRTFNIVSSSNRINGFRLAKSDSISDAGFKIQVSITLTSGKVAISQITKNISTGSDKGFFLVTPYLDNTPTLPDGVTAGTFLEAGVELSFDTNATFMFPNMTAYKFSSDTVRVLVTWPEIPKQGTNLVLTLPDGQLRAYDGEGVSTTLSESLTISNFVVIGKNIQFYINETGKFAGVNGGPLHFRWSGHDGKLTIT